MHEKNAPLLSLSNVLLILEIPNEKRKPSWDDYTAQVGKKRVTGTCKAAKKSPDCITVQRMSSEPTGRIKKYEPLDTRDFVNFSEFGEISIENVKEACEKHYEAPPGSCDILLGDKGPSFFFDRADIK